MMKSANFIMGKPELTALFRKPGHRSYRECQDQILRNFLKGIQIKYHKDGGKAQDEESSEPMKVTATPDKTQMAIKREAREQHNQEHGPNSDIINGPQDKPAKKKKDGFQWQPVKK